MRALALIAAAALAVPSPASACWFPSASVRAEAAAPVFGYTAIVAANDRVLDDGGAASVRLSLEVSRGLVGPEPYLTTLGGSLEEEIIVGCGPPRPDPSELAALARGTEVVVVGVDMPGRGMIVRFVEPVASDRGRALLADLIQRAGTP